jgi:hypothetical protein
LRGSRARIKRDVREANPAIIKPFNLDAANKTVREVGLQGMEKRSRLHFRCYTATD